MKPVISTIDAEIKDENVSLISATPRLLDEADKVRKHHERLIRLIRESTTGETPKKRRRTNPSGGCPRLDDRREGTTDA